MKKRKVIRGFYLALLCLSITFTQGMYMCIDRQVKADDLIKYTVMYSANRGYGVPYSQIKYHDVPLKLTATEPSRSGYVFMGWGTSSNATSVAYKPGDMYRDNRNITLYAIWGKTDDNGKVTVDSGNKKPAWSYQPNYSGVNKITASSKTVTYGSKSFHIKAKAAKGGTLTYKSSNKKVATISSSGKVNIKGYGKTKITIKSPTSGTFSADTKRITIQVVPKKMKLYKVSSPSKGRIYISWKKNSTVSGYMMKISRVMKFDDGTKTHVIGKKNSYVTVCGMNSNRLYYVRIRAYKRIGKTKVYGKWSSVKRAKIK